MIVTFEKEHKLYKRFCITVLYFEKNGIIPGDKNRVLLRSLSIPFAGASGRDSSPKYGGKGGVLEV